MRDLKLLVIADARWGKDHASEYICKKLGLTFDSSSMFCAKEFIFDALKDKYGYKTLVECFEDRVNHRAEWHTLIQEYNSPDKAKLARAIFAEHDIYCGLRDDKEFYAIEAAELFDFAIWIDASQRLPAEDRSSMKLDQSMANITVPNNGNLQEFELALDELCYFLNAWRTEDV